MHLYLLIAHIAELPQSVAKDCTPFTPLMPSALAGSLAYKMQILKCVSRIEGSALVSCSNTFCSFPNPLVPI